jgi:hypothetical protein
MSLQLPEHLHDLLAQEAKARGIPHDTFARECLEDALKISAPQPQVTVTEPPRPQYLRNLGRDART